MSQIPVKVTEKQFDLHFAPCLSQAQRGYVSQIPLYRAFNYILYWLHTGCQWAALPIVVEPNAEKKISDSAVYLHFARWSRDGSFKRVWQQSIQTVQAALDLSELNLDGTHCLAKKGGESVAYQERKKGKTCNSLPLMDKQGYGVASTGLLSDNHNDAFNLKVHLQTAFRELRQLGLDVKGAYFNADMAFDTRDARKTCFNYGVQPNIPENSRNRCQPKRGRKRLFNAEVYAGRFCAERTFAWVDKFKRLLIRFERYDACCLGAHYLAFVLINLRHVLAEDTSQATTPPDR